MSDKAALRRAATARRAALPAAQREGAGRAYVAALAALLPDSGRVAAYVGVGTEPDTGPLLARCRQLRLEVLLPVVLPDGDLDWALASPLAPGRLGIPEPTGPRLGRDAVAQAGLVVVPALAVDRHGTRLGRGGGCYDRALPRATAPTVALLYDGETVEQLPSEPHDVPVAALVTPSGGLVGTPW